MSSQSSLIATILSSLKPERPRHTKLLERAAKPGRTRSVAEQLIRATLEDPLRATSISRSQLRAASFLHSNERRLIGDALADIFRLENYLQTLAAETTEENRAALYWSSWLWLQGAEAEHLANDLSEQHIDALLTPCDPSEARLALARAASIPLAAMEELKDTFGDKTLDLILALNERAPIVLRVNPRFSTREAVLEQLTNDGIEAQASEFTEHGIIVLKRANLQGHRLFQCGGFEIQDEASQLVTRAVPRESTSIIDYCAGAGGKTLHLAATFPKSTQIIACDVRATALEETRKRHKRSRGPHRITTHLLPKDYAKLPQVDCVLVDAPCSGSGILRRHPHNRHNLGDERLNITRGLQQEILPKASQKIRRGGTLIYATCSILPSENEHQVKQFLSENQDFELEPIEDWWAEGAKRFGHGGFLRADPLHQGTDGFFVARLRKR